MLAGVLAATELVWSVDPPAPPTGQQIEEMIATPKGPEDHEALARHFESEAKTFEAEAEQHLRDAAQYRKSAVYGKLQKPMIEHCNRLARMASNAGKEAAAMAKMHRDLAKAR